MLLSPYLCGVVAQLVERDVRIVEVRGSTPLGSTISFVNNCVFEFFVCDMGIMEVSVTEPLLAFIFAFNANLI